MASISRRQAIRVAGAGVIAAAAAARSSFPAAAGREFCFFSKHLPDLGWADLGKAVKDAGFDGVDLTVRAQGHVLPERAAQDLPRALDAIKSQGVSVPMVTTDLTSAAHPNAKALLQAAARGGVRYFKPGYWRYSGGPNVRAELTSVGEAVAGLAALARDCGIEMGFHNHAAYVGAAIWDVVPIIERLDAKWAGYYFDPRHAVAEGGGGAYKAATHAVLPRLKMVALKDFYWLKTDKGWRIENCPMGQGMVDWPWMGSVFGKAGFSGPVSLHLEYEIPGSTAQERTRHTIQAAVSDLAFSKKAFA